MCPVKRLLRQSLIAQIVFCTLISLFIFADILVALTISPTIGVMAVLGCCLIYVATIIWAFPP